MKDPFAKSKVRQVTLKNLHEFRRFLRGTDKIYEVAKKVTLEAGFPYTDPRTGETTQPPKGKTKMPNNNKKPKWVLLDQIHVDIDIRSDMPAKERRDLQRVADRMIEGVIMGGDKRIRVRISR